MFLVTDCRALIPPHTAAGNSFRLVFPLAPPAPPEPHYVPRQYRPNPLLHTTRHCLCTAAGKSLLMCILPADECSCLSDRSAFCVQELPRSGPQREVPLECKSSGIAQKEVLNKCQSSGQVQSDVFIKGQGSCQAQSEALAGFHGSGKAQCEVPTECHVIGQAQKEVSIECQSSGQLQSEVPAVRQSSNKLQGEVLAVHQSSNKLQSEVLAVHQSSSKLQSEIPAVRQSSSQLQSEVPAVRQSSSKLQSEVPAENCLLDPKENEVLVRHFGGQEIEMKEKHRVGTLPFLKLFNQATVHLHFTA